jgi:hypothetical protein
MYPSQDLRGFVGRTNKTNNMYKKEFIIKIDENNDIHELIINNGNDSKVLISGNLNDIYESEYASLFNEIFYIMEII